MLRICLGMPHPLENRHLDDGVNLHLHVIVDNLAPDFTASAQLDEMIGGFDSQPMNASTPRFQASTID